MSVEFPRPTYSSTTPARPRLQIPDSPTLSTKALSAPACHPEKMLVTPASALMTSTNLSPCSMPEPIVHALYNQNCGSWTYLIADPVTEKAVIIDPTLDYDQQTNAISTKSADQLLDMVLREGYMITLLLETRLHRSHVTASRYLQHRLADFGQKATICAGSAINQNKASSHSSPDTSASRRSPPFDYLFKDYESFRIGNIVADVVHLPFADAPENIAYLVGVNVFTTISHAARDTPVSNPLYGPSTTSPSSTHFSVTINPSSTDEGWKRLMNLPTICKVYGGSQESQAHPYLTYEETRALHDQTISIPGSAAPGLSHETQSTLSYYATDINARGGKIPSKINVLHAEDGSNEKLEPLKIPRKLARLLE